MNAQTDNNKSLVHCQQIDSAHVASDASFVVNASGVAPPSVVKHSAAYDVVAYTCHVENVAVFESHRTHHMHNLALPDLLDNNTVVAFVGKPDAGRLF